MGEGMSLAFFFEEGQDSVGKVASNPPSWPIVRIVTRARSIGRV